MTSIRAELLSNPVRRCALTIGAAVALLGLSGCAKKPEGQVVAVVNGNEVTAQEVNGELGAAAAQGNPDQQMRNTALARLIDRRLLAQVAAKDGVENSPEYILRKRNLEENLLVQLMGEKLARDIKQPSAQQIDRLIAENPQAFGDRTVFALDQIVFPMAPGSDILAALAPAKSMAEIVTALNKAGIKFQRGDNTVDSANLPPQLFQEFKRYGSSEPLIIPTGGAVTVAMIMDSKPAPVTGPQARAVAGNAYTKREVEKALKAKLDAARKDAKIEYQTGFAAPATAGAPGSAGAPAGPGAAPAAPTPPQ